MFPALAEFVQTPLLIDLVGLKHERPTQLIARTTQLSILPPQKLHHLWQPVGPHDHDGKDANEEQLIPAESKHDVGGSVGRGRSDRAVPWVSRGDDSRVWEPGSGSRFLGGPVKIQCSRKRSR